MNGVVKKVADNIGNMAIPANGYVLSGHGSSRSWLRSYARVGGPVGDGSVATPPPSPTNHPRS